MLTAIQRVAQTDLPQMMSALLVVLPALGQSIAVVAAGDVGVEVGSVVGHDSPVGSLQGIVSRGEPSLALPARSLFKNQKKLGK